MDNLSILIKRLPLRIICPFFKFCYETCGTCRQRGGGGGGGLSFPDREIDFAKNEAIPLRVAIAKINEKEE